MVSMSMGAVPYKSPLAVRTWPGKDAELGGGVAELLHNGHVEDSLSMAKVVARAKKKTLSARETKLKDRQPMMPPALVSFSFHDVAYQIDVEKSKVYRRFIEIEKSKQFSIINAYRSISRPTA